MADLLRGNWPANFSGRARLFPLPNFVLFPHVAQPLHVYEPRYQQLVRDALDDDRLIAMALLQPGWESDYEGCPAVAPIVCFGQIASHVALEEGRSNLLLLGVRRARIVREVATDKLYRQADVELIEDLYPAAGATRRPRLQRDLVERFCRLAGRSTQVQAQFEQLLAHQAPLGVLADIVAFTLDLSVAAKQSLLAEPDVDRRSLRLVATLDTLLTEGSPRPLYPPPESDN